MGWGGLLITIELLLPIAYSLVPRPPWAPCVNPGQPSKVNSDRRRLRRGDNNRSHDINHHTSGLQVIWNLMGPRSKQMVAFSSGVPACGQFGIRHWIRSTTLLTIPLLNVLVCAVDEVNPITLNSNLYM